MRTLGLILAVMLVAVTAQAQCVATIQDVVQDEVRGSIIVKTLYEMNGVKVQDGQTRYLETSGTNAEIIAKAKEDVDVHCKNLVKRIEANRTAINTARLTKQKELTAPVITSIKGSLVGHKVTVTEAVDVFKGKETTVNANSTTSVRDVAYTAPVSR